VGLPTPPFLGVELFADIDIMKGNGIQTATSLGLRNFNTLRSIGASDNVGSSF
jgi:hypothetical protein